VALLGVGVFGLIQPPISNYLHAGALRKKRYKRRKCPRVPLDWSDAAGERAGYFRTRVRSRASTRTLWELCTMIPIKALR
jgi:hypothetical protein